MLSVTFDVDHKVLERGVYLAKVDRADTVYDLTLDIRLRRPYREERITETQMHTFEHSYATAIRKVMDGDGTARVIYFGPMGCATGFYLIFQVCARDEQALEKIALSLPEKMDKAVDVLLAMQTVPAANEWQCGYCYTLGDAAMAARMGLELREILQEVRRSGFSHYVRLSGQQLAEIEGGEKQ